MKIKINSVKEMLACSYNKSKLIFAKRFIYSLQSTKINHQTCSIISIVNPMF